MLFPKPHEGERVRRVHNIRDEAEDAARVQLLEGGAGQRVHGAWRAAGVPLRQGGGARPVRICSAAVRVYGLSHWLRTALECWHKTHRAAPTPSPRPARATGSMASTMPTVYPCGAGSVCRCGFQTVLWKYAVYSETGPFHPEKAQFPAGKH